jgi:long-chain fatty acid transport protein
MKRIVVYLAAVAIPMSASALGIRLFDHDAFATARGDAFVATADNPSALYYNPAGITQLEGHQVRGVAYTVGVTSDFDPASGGRDWRTEGGFMPLPGFFYVYAPEKLPLSFGAAYYMPYGLALEWPDRVPFRYITTQAALEYHTLSGVIAWEATPTLSIGAGPTINFAGTDLRRGVTAPGDEFRFTGTDMDFGAVAGILWKPFTRHAFGVSYRSETTMNFEGTSRTSPQYLPRQDAEARVPFPQVIIAGYSFRPTTNWNFEIDVDWTDWDQLDTPVLKQSTGNIPLPLEWESSWALEVGGTRYFRESGLHVSAGYVFIENSVPEDSFNPMVPDQDLHVFSAGVGGQHGRLAWDLTYQYTFGTGRTVSSSVNGPTVSGDYDFNAHGISASLGWRF